VSAAKAETVEAAATAAIQNKRAKAFISFLLNHLLGWIEPGSLSCPRDFKLMFRPNFVLNADLNENQREVKSSLTFSLTHKKTAPEGGWKP
ncbi:MAG TPA: hypothetical protein VMB23_04950, partial [Spirochaetia bacterium]|nr:hypothetical protein [Spirochaetia bacterium]